MPGRIETQAPWKQLIEKCFQERVLPNRFEKFAALLHTDQTPGIRICEILLDGTSKGASIVDPLLGKYTRKLLELGCIRPSELLKALLERSKLTSTDDPAVNDNPLSGRVSVEVQLSLLATLARSLAEDGKSDTDDDVRSLLTISAQWMQYLSDSHQSSMLADLSTDKETAHANSMLLPEAFATCFLAISEDSRVRQVLDGVLPKDTGADLQSSLTKFSAMLGSASTQLTTRINIVQHTYPSLQPKASTSLPDAANSSIDMRELQLNSMPNRLETRSRSGLTVFIDSLLCNLPAPKAEKILAYLRARYKSNATDMILDLVTSGFDHYRIAITRGKESNTAFLSRTFLVNKLPLLLGALSSSSTPNGSVSFIVAEALTRVSDGLALDAGGDSHSDFSEARSEFVSACVMHGLIQSERAQQLLGGLPLQDVQQHSKLSKEGAIRDLQKDPQKLSNIADGLILMDGNASIRAEAIGQVCQSLCKAGDTLTLKSFCLALLPRGEKLDVLFLCADAPSLVEALCELLDGWKYGEDSVDYHACYTEFSACLTLLLACTRRFRLHAADLKIHRNASFVRWILEGQSVSFSLTDLSAEQNNHLKDWIKSLFEHEGIADDQLSNCPPDTFYKLVPILFHHIAIACRNGKLSKDKLQNGLELLLEPLLLPSVDIGLLFLVNHGWKHPSDVQSVLQIIRILTRPLSTEAEAASMHQSLVKSTSDELMFFLESLQDYGISNEVIKPLLDGLKPHTSLDHRSSRISHDTVQAQFAAPNILQQFGNSFNELCNWGLSGLMSSPPSYSHQDIITAITVCGASRVVRSLIDLIETHSHTDTGDVALDLASSVVCAESFRFESMDLKGGVNGGLTLRQALQIERNNAATMMTKALARAEWVVLLHRKVEDQAKLAPTEPVSIDLPEVIGQLGIDQPMIGSLDDAGATNSTNTLDLALEHNDLDFGMGSEFSGLQMGIGQAGGGVTLQEGLRFTQPTAAPMTQEQTNKQGDQSNLTGYQWEQAFDFDPQMVADGQTNSGLAGGQNQEVQQGEPRKASITFDQQTSGQAEEQNEEDFWNSLTEGFDPGMGF